MTELSVQVALGRSREIVSSDHCVGASTTEDYYQLSRGNRSEAVPLQLKQPACAVKTDLARAARVVCKNTICVMLLHDSNNSAIRQAAADA